MWYAPKKFCTLTLLSFLNSSQTTNSPKLFSGLGSRIEVWKLQTNYVTKHFFVKIKELNTKYYSTFPWRLDLKGLYFVKTIFSLQLLRNQKLQARGWISQLAESFWQASPFKRQTNFIFKKYRLKLRSMNGNFLQQFLKVTARHSRFQGTDIEHREHMGLKHASREKKCTMVIFLIFVLKNVYRIRFQKIKIGPLKGFEKKAFFSLLLMRKQLSRGQKWFLSATFPTN